MKEGYARIPIASPVARWLSALAIFVVAISAGIFVVRWAIAETVVELAGRGPIDLQLVAAARTFQPWNPETSYITGLYALDSAQPPDVAGAGRLLDEAARLAPNRPVYWLAVGRQREVAGLADEAEAAFGRAASIAPSHWKPRWMLGNLYVRLGRFQDAVEPLRMASALNPSIAPLAARTIWGATGRGDAALLQTMTGTSVAGRAALVDVWISEGRLDEALARWNDLFTDAGTQPVVTQIGLQLADRLRIAGRGGEYADIVSRLDPERGAALDTIANASFDDPISENETWPFAWKVTRSPEARVSVDAGRTGGKSLRIDYSSKGGARFEHASQTVRVQAGAAYDLSMWVVTEKLQSGGPPIIAVADASGATTVLGSASVPTSATEWMQISVRFTAPPSGLVTVRILREPCGQVCPIMGTIRFDEATLTR